MYQLDHGKGNLNYFNLPRNSIIRNNAFNRIYFVIPKDIDPTKYSVAIEILDNSNPGERYRSIGKLSLQRNVEMSVLQVPDVILPWNGKVLLLPENEGMQRFIGVLERGATYVICTKTGKLYKR